MLPRNAHSCARSVAAARGGSLYSCFFTFVAYTPFTHVPSTFAKATVDTVGTNGEAVKEPAVAGVFIEIWQTNSYLGPRAA